MLAPKKCKIVIYNETYSLISDEPEEHVSKSAQLVDTLLRQAVMNNPSIDLHNNLILITLRLASNCIKLDSQNDYAKILQEKMVEMINRELSL